jgi:hypothetical protein
MTQPKPHAFPAFPAFPNWQTVASAPDSGSSDTVFGHHVEAVPRNQIMKRKASIEKTRGLFPNESEIARRLSQNPLDWPAKALVLERHGLPRIDPLMGGRYWPAVEAYWHRRYGLSSIEVHQPDGKENFDAL